MSNQHKPLTFPSASQRLRRPAYLTAQVVTLRPTFLAEHAEKACQVRVLEAVLKTRDCGALPVYAEDHASRVTLTEAFHQHRPVTVLADSELCLHGSIKISDVTLL